MHVPQQSQGGGRVLRSLVFSVKKSRSQEYIDRSQEDIYKSQKQTFLSQISKKKDGMRFQQSQGRGMLRSLVFFYQKEEEVKENAEA